MREILFRGRQRYSDKWIIGDLWRSDLYGKTSIITPEQNVIGVEASTIGQYTGLTDKNGQKIFEGDILSILGADVPPWADADDKVETHHEVVWHHFGWWLYSRSPAMVSNYEPLGHYVGGFRPITVIGNIHDTPELMAWQPNDEEKEN